MTLRPRRGKLMRYGQRAWVYGARGEVSVVQARRQPNGKRGNAVVAYGSAAILRNARFSMQVKNGWTVTGDAIKAVPSGAASFITHYDEKSQEWVVSDDGTEWVLRPETFHKYAVVHGGGRAEVWE